MCVCVVIWMKKPLSMIQNNIELGDTSLVNMQVVAQ